MLRRDIMSQKPAVRQPGGRRPARRYHCRMFSYRHAFHAGNHADVLKHTVLVATLQHLTEKEAALTVVDTHAGAGLYRLDGDYASTSGEAAHGIHALAASDATLAPALQAYLDLVRAFNHGPAKQPRVYPGSPFIAQRLLRPHDRLKLYELHPSDARALDGNIAQLDAGRQVAVLREDGFGSAVKFLPPPSRRALVLCDPSYEMKTDYARVLGFAAEALKRFATGTYAVWYPIIPRPEAHDLPRRLRTLATQAGRSWLHAALTVKSSRISQDAATGETRRPGLPASGMFLINPPYTLKAALAPALPQLVEILGQDRHASFVLETGG
ncbi:MAG: Ribosomal RNA large subunit methyltransferase J [Xylophilus sp.]|nr:MAG: Ribosomal RNA large subunit methyltransferase J [Xylophilus sp.]